MQIEQDYLKVEYRVRKVERFIVTRYALRGDSRKVSDESRQIGNEFASEEIAYEVAYALARAEHERLGFPPGDERIIYPQRLSLNEG